MRIERRHVEPREVMTHFCDIEHEKERGCEGMPMPDYRGMGDQELEHAVKRFCFRGEEEKPVGHYLAGDRKQQIAELVLAWIPAGELYSCGVDSHWNPLLERSNRNLAMVVNRYGDDLNIRAMRYLNNALSIIVTIKRPSQHGEFEVIDGFHRAVALIHGGQKEIESYVGILRNDPEWAYHRSQFRPG